MVLTLEEAGVSFGAHTVLENVNIQIKENSRIGLVGINGAGKSTLLKLISGEIPPDCGKRTAGATATIGFLRQNAPVTLQGTLYEQMQAVFSDTYAVIEKLQKQQQQLSTLVDGTEEYQRCAGEIERLSRRIASADGYQIDVKIATVLTGLGFTKERWDLPVQAMSGGERVRAGLAQLLLSEPTLLLLDEPTNHLDFSTLAFLEQYISEYRGAVVIVSHDRYFLDRTVNEIWEVYQPQVICYPGNYTKYKQLRKERYERMEKEYDAYVQRRAQLSDYVARNIVRASSSAMAKSRQKELEKMEAPPKPPRQTPYMQFSFSAEKKSAFAALQVEGLALSAGDKQLFSGLDFSLTAQKKVALVGDNGVGKTTLLNALVGKACPTTGQICWGKNVTVGYYEQHQTLPSANSVFDIIREKFPSDTDGEIRSLLARVQLKGDAVFSAPDALSGGQRAGVCFALLMRQRDNVLLLDEPTNHLDLHSRESLEKALAEYEGTLLIVSHDRYLLQTVPDEIWRLTPGGIVKYDTFAQIMEEQNVKEKPASTGKVVEKNTREQRRQKALWRQSVSRIEAQIATAEEQLRQVTALLEQPDEALAGDFQRMQALYEQSATLTQQIDLLSEQWLELQLQGE